MQFTSKQHLLLGQFLTRRDVSALFGGNTRTFLPRTQGRVVAGCFDPSMNPRVPGEILIGAGRTALQSAKLFIAHGDAVPFFIKRAPAKWEYLGNFKAVSFSTDKRQVDCRVYEIIPRIYETYRKSYGDIRGILFLEEE